MAKNEFLNAFLEFEQKNGISQEIIVQALADAFTSIIKKKNFEDTDVRVNIDVEKGTIQIFNVRDIVDEVEDSALQVSHEEALQEIKDDPKCFIDGTKFFSPISLQDFQRSDAMKVKGVFKQKIKEAEKAILYAAYKDKVGELVSGYVEKVEDRYILINLGRTSVVLQDKNKIGNETFKTGDLVKVYLSEVNSSTQGPQIIVSRSDKNFLKRLFEEEIHDVYSGTVIINDIARSAGLRSKVSVSSLDPNVDPVGSCIGQGGSKIQKICNQINHEKIDVIQYHEYLGLFVAEALKPASVVGVKIVENEADNKNKKAIVVIKDGEQSVAIGTKGVNVRLASSLTHCQIEVKEESVAKEEGIEFETIPQMTAKEEQLIFEKKRQEILEAQARDEEERQKRILEEENNHSDDVKEEKVEEATEEEKVEEATEEKVEEVKEEVKESQPVTLPAEEKVEYKPVNLGKKISLSDLEKQIEEEKKKVTPKQNIRKFKKEEENEPVKEVKEEKKVDPKSYMDIYTNEELEELENEEEYDDSYDDDDIDYTEYDKYYEE